MSMGQLANCIASAASTGRPSESWIREYAEHTRSRLHHLSSSQLSSVLRSIVALGHQPGEGWLADFDATCFSHWSFDTRSAVEVLACMDDALLRDAGFAFAFPQAVYIKVMADPSRFESYTHLAALLHCLGDRNVPSGWDEARFLDAVGARMGQVLTSMPAEEAVSVVMTSRGRVATLAAILRVETDECPALW